MNFTTESNPDAAPTDIIIRKIASTLGESLKAIKVISISLFKLCGLRDKCRIDINLEGLKSQELDPVIYRSCTFQELESDSQSKLRVQFSSKPGVKL